MRVFVAVLAFAAVAAAGVIVDRPEGMPIGQPVMESESLKKVEEPSKVMDHAAVESTEESLAKKLEPVSSVVMEHSAMEHAPIQSTEKSLTKKLEPVSSVVMEHSAMEHAPIQSTEESLAKKLEPVSSVVMEHSAMEEMKAKTNVPVEPAELLENILAKMDPSAKLISLYSDPQVDDSLRTHERGGMKSVLEGPVMVAFKDSKENHMNAFLLPTGFRASNAEDSAWRVVSSSSHPLGRFLFNGNKKAFLYLSAGSAIQLPEMYKTFDDIELVSYKLRTAYDIAKYSSPYPYVLIVDAAAIEGRVANLKEEGVFTMEKDGLKIVKDNIPSTEHAMSRSFESVIEYTKPVFVEKDLIRAYTKPVFVEKDLVREYIPAYAGQGFVREYTKPIYSDFIRGDFKPTFAAQDFVREYTKPMYAGQGFIREYTKPVYSEVDFIRGDSVREYISPIEKDLVGEFL